MIIIKKGKYKNLSLTINHNGDVIIKSPKFLHEKEIENFYISKKEWIDKHINFIKTQEKIKNHYDFKNYVYLYNKKYAKISSKKEMNIIYIENFNSEIIQLVNKISKITGIKSPQSIKSIKSKRIWGSLSNKNEMKLNILISILPQELIKYIIIHELCHSIEFNHSKQFWNLVSNFLPNYKELKKSLEKYSFILRADIL